MASGSEARREALEQQLEILINHWRETVGDYTPRVCIECYGIDVCSCHKAVFWPIRQVIAKLQFELSV